MSQGWIKLHRKMWNNPVVSKDAEHVALWVYLLTHATHQNYDTLWKGEKITLRPGQLITGRKKLSTETGIEQSKVVRILKHFKNEHQIEQQTSNQGSLISILAWDKYQIIEQQNEQRVNNDRTTSEQRVNTKQEYKEQKEHKETREIYMPPETANRIREIIKSKSKGDKQ